MLLADLDKRAEMLLADFGKIPYDMYCQLVVRLIRVQHKLDARRNILTLRHSVHAGSHILDNDHAERMVNVCDTITYLIRQQRNQLDSSDVNYLEMVAAMIRSNKIPKIKRYEELLARTDYFYRNAFCGCDKCKERLAEIDTIESTSSRNRKDTKRDVADRKKKGTTNEGSIRRRISVGISCPREDHIRALGRVEEESDH